MPLYEIKKKFLKGLKNCICYRRISVTLGSVIAGFNCIWYVWYDRLLRLNISLSNKSIFVFYDSFAPIRDPSPTDHLYGDKIKVKVKKNQKLNSNDRFHFSVEC